VRRHNDERSQRNAPRLRFSNSHGDFAFSHEMDVGYIVGFPSMRPAAPLWFFSTVGAEMEPASLTLDTLSASVDTSSTLSFYRSFSRWREEWGRPQSGLDPPRFFESLAAFLTGHLQAVLVTIWDNSPAIQLLSLMGSSPGVRGLDVSTLPIASLTGRAIGARHPVVCHLRDEAVRREFKSPSVIDAHDLHYMLSIPVEIPSRAGTTAVIINVFYGETPCLPLAAIDVVGVASDIGRILERLMYQSAGSTRSVIASNAASAAGIASLFD